MYLTEEDGSLRKPTKSDILREIKSNTIPFYELNFKMRCATFIDFMAYARKIDSRMKKYNLKTFGDCMANLWNTFQRFSAYSDRIDILFDNYPNNSIKAGERKRRNAIGVGIKINISHFDQPLPVLSEMPKFWACTENKINFQQFFIRWITDMYEGDKPIYLGGCHSNGENDYCYRITNKCKQRISSLYCVREEADDRIPFHISHAVQVDRIQMALVCSGDTDVYLSLMYHFKSWKEDGLLELWTERNEEVSPVHESVDNQPAELTKILPTIHALTGSDTTSKIGSKKKAVNVAKNEKHQVALQNFGIGALDTFMLQCAEAFLVDCISTRKSNLVGSNSFDQLRHLFYFDDKKFVLKKLPCTTNSLHLHIMRAYLQAHRWITAATLQGDSKKTIWSLFALKLYILV